MIPNIYKREGSIMARIEFRMQDTKMTSNGDMLVSGYVNETEQYSHELGLAKRFKEKITRGAFKRAISKSEHDIDFLAEHDNSVVLASTKNDTLQLREDEKGLYMEARIINTSAGRDWYEMISSGLITNMSFGFRSVADEWRSLGEDLYERTINELELFEVSAVRNPAYAHSSISNRGLDSNDDIVPENIEEDSNMEQRSVDQLVQAMQDLTAEMRELRGTVGKDKDGNDVPVQKDNYAVGQQTSTQASSEDDLKRIKADESPGKYVGNKDIDDKGSYNHDKNVPNADETGQVTNEPESQEGKVAKYDGSLPEDVPGTQNGEDAQVEDNTTQEPTQEPAQEPTQESGQTEQTTSEEGQARSISYDEFERQLTELRGGTK